jgi:hypothetical protein
MPLPIVPLAIVFGVQVARKVMVDAAADRVRKSFSSK